MGIDERSRHALYLQLEEALGPVEAGTLMEHLPPGGWADVAMKRDLDQHAALMKSQFDGVDARIDTLATREELERALHAQTLKFMTFVTGLVTSVAAIALAITRLT